MVVNFRESDGFKSGRLCRESKAANARKEVEMF